MIESIQSIRWESVALVVAIGGLFLIVGKFWRRNGDGKRLRDLEEFKEVAESNHFHDLENLKKDFSRFQNEHSEFRIKLENRLTRIETKLFNGNK